MLRHGFLQLCPTTISIIFHFKFHPHTFDHFLLKPFLILIYKRVKLNVYVYFAHTTKFKSMAIRTQFRQLIYLIKINEKIVIMKNVQKSFKCQDGDELHKSVLQHEL